MDIDEIHLVNEDHYSTFALIHELEVFKTKSNGNLIQYDGQFLSKANTNLYGIDQKINSETETKHALNNETDESISDSDSSLVSTLVNSDTEEDDDNEFEVDISFQGFLFENCDLCGQRVKKYQKIPNCEHIYCMGCLIDLNKNNNKCLLDDQTEKNETDRTFELRRSKSDDLSQSIEHLILHSSPICGICLKFEKNIEFQCHHELCAQCFNELELSNNFKPNCPFCGVQIVEKRN